MSLRLSTLMQTHHLNRDGGTCEMFLCASVGVLPPAAGDEMAMQDQWDVLKGVICTAEVFWMRERRNGDWNLSLSAYQHSTDLKTTVTFPSGLHSQGWTGQMMFESLISKPNTACEQHHRPCKVWNHSHSFRARHWTSENTAKALIDSAQELP